MPHDQLIALLRRARIVLDRYMFEAEGELIRDDVAEICMAIDDTLPEEGRVLVKKAELDRSALERTAA
jgi:hypothetical protein